MGNDKNNAVWVGFDLGATKMLAKVYNGGFNELGRNKSKTRSNQGMDAGLQRIVECIRKALDAGGVPDGNVAGIGVGSPGPLDLDKGVLLSPPNLGWDNAPLKKTLEKAFKCPAVVLNDVDAGVYGEYRQGAGRKARCVVGVFPGTGIGGGCVYEGRIIRGGNKSCFEIGHCRVLPDGPLCGCGRRGCLEAVANRLAIAAAASAAAYRGEAPYLLAQAGTDIAKIRSSVLAASIKAGDKAVERIVRMAASWIGVGISSAVNLMNPDVVVLGGGLVEAMPDIFREEVERAAREHVMPEFEKDFKVAVAELGDDAVAIGAAAWAREILTSK